MENHTQTPDLYTPPRQEPSRWSRHAQFAGKLTGRHGGGIIDPEKQPTDQKASTAELTEDFTEDMTHWIASLQDDATRLSTLLTDNGSRTKKTWALFDKMYEYERSGHEWLQEGDLVRRGIDKRYGSQQQLRNTETKLGKMYDRRRQQLDRAFHFNTVMEFADEIDPSTYRRFIPPPGQLGVAYNLPRTNSPTKDPIESARQLNKLPFVDRGQLDRTHDPKHPKIVIAGQFNFPTERILSVASFDSWAGRGQSVEAGRSVIVIPNGKGDKSFRPRVLHAIEPSSRGAITDYAQQDLSNSAASESSAHIMLFQDTDGEYWGMATTNGSHRVGAAKLRGDPTVPVSEIEIASNHDMPKVHYSINQRFGSGS